ncbi:MAG: glyoxalase superfamily protein, partial [Pseudomonadota bacterium]
MATLGPATPILRIFDEAKAREFYLDFLGFSVSFEHRFGEDFPLYMGVRQSGCELHLSEHHGDASPGAHVRIGIDNVNGFCRSLADKQYKFAKPGEGSKTPWGTVEATLT